MKKIAYTCLTLIGFAFTISCNEDDPVITKNFTVTVENAFLAKDYFSSGTTAFIEPGMSSSFSFEAGKGHYLSFATMFVQSNDLFYAPTATGIALYDANGNPLTGNVTSQINLWDGGTEVNEEPGVGLNQAPRQSAANTGTAESGTVENITNVSDGFTYPTDESVIEVTLTHDGNTMFTVTIKNVSDLGTFQTPFAPGNWVVHSGSQSPLFVEGSPASTDLERVAEDGDNSLLTTTLETSSGYYSPFAPGAFEVYTGANTLFINGEIASVSLESLAEDGDPSGFTSVFNTPTGGSSPAPIFSGESYSFTFEAVNGDKLSLATMLVQSNDLFVGIEGLDLYVDGKAIGGDITSSVKLWDAGTEANEYPGAGSNQAPRQSGANTGTSESGIVQVANDGFTYPATTSMVKVTITSN